MFTEGVLEYMYSHIYPLKKQDAGRWSVFLNGFLARRRGRSVFLKYYYGMAGLLVVGWYSPLALLIPPPYVLFLPPFLVLFYQYFP